MSNFDQIQGGETGESLLRASTVEPTLELIKIASAQWVARLFALLGVEPIGRERWGYTPYDLALSSTKSRSNVTCHRILASCKPSIGAPL
jgi:hypothetical protein